MMNGAGGDPVDQYERKAYNGLWEIRQEISDVRVEQGVHRTMLAQQREVLQSLNSAIEKLADAVNGLTTAETIRTGERRAMSKIWQLGKGAWIAIAAMVGTLWANWRVIHDFLMGGPKP